MLVQDSYTYTEAAISCAEQKGALASVDSQEKYDQIFQLFG